VGGHPTTEASVAYGVLVDNGEVSNHRTILDFGFNLISAI
jgi:hypothetical protein